MPPSDLKFCDRVKLTLLELLLAGLHTLGSLRDLVAERGLGIRWPRRVPPNQR